MSEPPQIVKNQKGCWYFTNTTECVLCGWGKTTRERRDPPAPRKEERYAFEQFACPQHFS